MLIGYRTLSTVAAAHVSPTNYRAPIGHSLTQGMGFPEGGLSVGPCNLDSCWSRRISAPWKLLVSKKQDLQSDGGPNLCRKFRYHMSGLQAL